MASAEGGAGRGIGAAGTGAARGAGARGRGGPAVGPGLGHGPGPSGEEALPLVGEVYGWLCWANQGTTRGLRNRPFGSCSSEETEETKRYPRGVGQPQRTMRGSSGQ